MAKRNAKSIKTSAVRAEAAQYALLCRISPALRHRLVGQLHPIGLAAGLADRQLRADGLNLTNVRDSIAKVQLQTREAMVSAIATLAWLTGEEAASVTLQAGVDSCVALVRTDCEMRGVAISSNIAGMDVAVSQRALRIVLTAALIAMVDMLPYLYRIELRSAISGKTIEIHFDLHFADATQAVSGVTEPRPLRWDDVDALADQEGVEVFRTVKPPKVTCRFDAAISEARSGHEKSSLAYNP